MPAKSGFGLKTLQWLIRTIQLLSAALILGVYSYFLAALANHNLPIATSIRAVEGIVGVAVLYTLSALLLLCCVAGLTLTAFLAVVLDVAFIGAFIYVAVANKGGARSCDGYVDTPFGKGKAADQAEGSGGFTALPSFGVACRLQSACLAVSIIAIFFFIFSILMEVALQRHHRRERRFGPSPANNYTSGSGSVKQPGGILNRLFRRNTVRTTNPDDALPEHTHPNQLDDGRHSYAGTERTAVNPTDYNKFEQGYGYQGKSGRGDGYGPIHYPEPEPQVAGTQQLAPGYEPQVAGTQQSAPEYRYDDGVYNRGHE